MAVPLTRAQQRIVAQTLAVVILAGGLQIFCGVVIRDSQPAFTFDICHPAQALVETSPVSFLPPLPLRGFMKQSPQRVGFCDTFVALKSRLGDAPQTPPPKTLD